MKISAAKADAFAHQPDPAARAVLVYGPDTGLVRERADALARTVVTDLSDPFLVADLAADGIVKDPARLADEAAAMALTGGRRVVRVRDCVDALAAAVETMLAAPTGDSLVVFQAGDLGPRSALRRLFEGAPDAAALPCYADDARDLDRLVHDVLAKENVSASPEAIAYLTDHLGSDRGVSRSELEKLATYACADGRIELEDAMAVVGDNAALSLDDLVFSTADGDRESLDRALERSLQEGHVPVAILRAMARHLLRLQIAAARVAAGGAPDQAMKALRPPVFFKRQPQFRRQLTAWRGDRIARALDLTLSAEHGCKTTGMPDAAICGRALLQIAALARRSRKPR
ncbi:MAG: DNA polymerase III subunit delta [Alphaproteobacteria bacterium]|nr:DNA polymerase III subunit delta [Alphaproteobacteria bacterium]